MPKQSMPIRQPADESTLIGRAKKKVMSEVKDVESAGKKLYDTYSGAGPVRKIGKMLKGENPDD